MNCLNQESVISPLAPTVAIWVQL